MVNADVTMYTVAPVVADGVIYGMSNKRRGQFVALRASDGWLKWAVPVFLPDGLLVRDATSVQKLLWP